MVDAQGKCGIPPALIFGAGLTEAQIARAPLAPKAWPLTRWVGRMRHILARETSDPPSPQR
jgi:hypothetical protein